MKIRTVQLFCLLACTMPALADEGLQSIGDVTAVKEVSDGVEVSAGAARVRLNAITPNIIRVLYAPTGNFPPDHSFAVISNILKPAPNGRVQQTENSVTLNAGAVQARISRSPLRIAFLDENGRTISEDQASHPVSFNGSEFRVWKSMPEDEHYF